MPSRLLPPITLNTFEVSEEYRGYLIRAQGKMTETPGGAVPRSVSASFLVLELDGSTSKTAGIVAGGFTDLEEAQATMLARGRAWIDARLPTVE